MFSCARLNEYTIDVYYLQYLYQQYDSTLPPKIQLYSHSYIRDSQFVNNQNIFRKVNCIYLIIVSCMVRVWMYKCCPTRLKQLVTYHTEQFAGFKLAASFVNSKARSDFSSVATMARKQSYTSRTKQTTNIDFLSVHTAAH